MRSGLSNRLAVFIAVTATTFLGTMLAPAAAQPLPRIEVAGEFHGPHRVLVDGVVVFTDTEAATASVKQVVMSGPARFALIEFNSGGTACPAMYRAIDLSGPRAVVSPEFGTCSDLPAVSVREGVLHVTMPRMGRRGTEAFAFGAGRLTVGGRVVGAAPGASVSAPQATARPPEAVQRPASRQWERVSDRDDMAAAEVRGQRGVVLRFQCDVSGSVGSLKARLVVPVGFPPRIEPGAVSLVVGRQAHPLPMQHVADSDEGTMFEAAVSDRSGISRFRDIVETMELGSGDFEVRAGSTVVDRFVLAGADWIGDGVVNRCSPAYINAAAVARGNSNAQVLVGMQMSANGRCRGGSGDDPATWEACAERLAFQRRLAALNWCYGRRGEAGYQMQWHRCGPNSLR